MAISVTFPRTVTRYDCKDVAIAEKGVSEAISVLKTNLADKCQITHVLLDTRVQDTKCELFYVFSISGPSQLVFHAKALVLACKLSQVFGW